MPFHQSADHFTGNMRLPIGGHSTSLMHGYDDTKPQIYWGRDFGLLVSRDVIGHVTIGLAIGSFL